MAPNVTSILEKRYSSLRDEDGARRSQKIRRRGLEEGAAATHHQWSGGVRGGALPRFCGRGFHATARNIPYEGRTLISAGHRYRQETGWCGHAVL